MNEASLLSRRDAAVAWLRLNRPEALNALDLDLAQRLAQALPALSSDPAVRAIVIEGAGRAFCAGGDVLALRDDPARAAPALIEAVHAAILAIDAARVPVLAKVNGPAAGAGLSLLLACDLAIAADDARLNLAYVNIGASCDASSSWHLPRIVGLRRAMEIALLGEDVGAAEACRLGLVNCVVPAAELDAAAAQLAARLAAGPTLALGAIKRLLRDAPQRGLAGQLDAERDAFLACARSEDFRAGLDAFAGRRSPTFAGR